MNTNKAGTSKPGRSWKSPILIKTPPLGIGCAVSFSSWDWLCAPFFRSQCKYLIFLLKVKPTIRPFIYLSQHPLHICCEPVEKSDDMSGFVSWVTSCCLQGRIPQETLIFDQLLFITVPPLSVGLTYVEHLCFDLFWVWFLNDAGPGEMTLGKVCA